MRTQPKRVLALLLTLAMMLSLLPVGALAAGEKTFTRVRTLSELGAGKYLIVAKATNEDSTTTDYAMSDLTGARTEVAISGDAISTSNEALVWSFDQMSGANDYSLTLDGSEYLSWTAKASFSNSTTPYAWTANQLEDGLFSIVASTTATATTVRAITLRNITTNAFRPYAVSNNSGEYSPGIMLFKLDEGGPVKQVSTPTADPASGAVVSGTKVALDCATPDTSIYYVKSPTETPTASSTLYTAPIEITADTTIRAIAIDPTGKQPQSELATFTYTLLNLAKTDIAAARTKLGEMVQVAGTVVYIDGKSVYLQDATGGIVARFAENSTLKVGQVLDITGTVKAFSGLLQLDPIAASVPGAVGQPLPAPKSTTIAALAAGGADVEAMESTRVKLTGATVISIDDSYATYNIRLSAGADATAATIEIYKCPATKGIENFMVGATVDVIAVVDQSTKTTDDIGYRLRVASTDDFTAVTPPSKVAAPTAKPDSGTVYPNGEIALSTTTTDAVISYNTTAADAPAAAWIVGTTYQIPATAAVGTVIKLYAKATHAAIATPSDVAAFTYTVAAKPVIADPIPDKDPVFTGDVKNIKDFIALEDTKTGTVAGQLVYRFGNADAMNSAILQDVIDGVTYSLQVYNDLSDFAIGDVVTLVGQKTTYSGTPQIQTLTDSKKVSTITAAPMAPEAYETFAELKADGSNRISRMVKISNVTLGEYKGDGSTIVTDGAGGTMSIYRAATYPVGVGKGEVVDLYAILSTNSGNLQLRVGSAIANGRPTYAITNDSKAPIITLPETWLKAEVGKDYLVAVPIVDNVGVDSADISYTIGKAVKTAPMTLNKDTQAYAYTIPGKEITSGTLALTLTISAKDAKGNAQTTKVQTIAIEDLPQVGAVTPPRGSSTQGNKTPELTVTFTNAGETPTVVLTLTTGKTVIVDKTAMTVQDGKASWKPAAALADGLHTANVTITRLDKKTMDYTWSFTVGVPEFQPYFGQLHSHTAYSDGAGTLEKALTYIKDTAKNNNVQFVSFTDHSNYFDTSGSPNPAEALYDMSKASTAAIKDGKNSMQMWGEYKQQISAFNADAGTNGVLALGGFEMTWSGGPGHINTFNTPGIVSRNNKELGSKSGVGKDQGMQDYYKLLSQPEGAESISQFNHPGTTFGTFSDFAHWDPIIDSRVALIEVGNGEGQIGAGGYYPSYEHYTTALDKGWHVAPTNNQDNHKGRWGDANDARSVIITKDFTEEGLYNAMQARSMYASEDKNLSINYTVNDQIMGARIETIPTELAVRAVLVDPDSSVPGDKISKVEVIANSGRVVFSQSVNAHEYTLETTLAPEYSYYYLRVTQADGNIAVTAPVWVGKGVVVGISSLACGTAIPVTGEKLTLTTTLFNSETTDATMDSISYAVKGGEVIYEGKPATVIASMSTLNHSVDYTFNTAGLRTIVVTAVISAADVKYTFTKEIALDILDSEKLVYVGIDASHFNEYVAGNYKDSMGNFGALAAQYNVRTVELKTSEAFIAATANPRFVMLVITAPSRRNGNITRDPYVNYSDAEVKAIAAFAAQGKTVVVAGWADYYENYDGLKDKPKEDHMSAQQNKLLAAMGSKLRLSDDGSLDDKENGGQSPRLYLSDYNDFKSPLTKGIVYDPTAPKDNTKSQVFSQYGGSTIYAVESDGKTPAATLPKTVTPIISGHSTTYSKDQDADGVVLGLPSATIPKYNSKVLLTASEEIVHANGKTSLVVVSGGAFMSNFEIQATLDNSNELTYSNYNILENLIAYVNPIEITPIADVHKANEGVKFSVEGIVTSNASGFDRDTAFFDCIYLEDATGGINVFPVAGNYQVGQKLRLTGITSSYQGERQLDLSKGSVKLLAAEPVAVTPTAVTTEQAATGQALGKLVKLDGVVVSFTEAEGAVQTIIVCDNTGYDARVFIDGYITLGKDAALRVNLGAGHKITVVGLASYDNTFVGSAGRIRVRDRADVVCSAEIVDIPSNQVAAPTAKPESGNVHPGGEIVLSTTTAGAVISYNTTAADAPATAWTVGTTYQVPEAAAVGTVITLYAKATHATIKNPSDVVAFTYTVYRESTGGGGGGTPTSPQIGPSDITVGKDSITITLTSGKRTLTTAASEKLVQLNADKPVKLSGAGLTITIPKGVLGKNADVNAMIVDTKVKGNAIRVTHSDGTTSILPYAVLGTGSASYLANQAGKYEIVDNTKTFPDLKESHWAKDAVAFVSTRGIFNGLGNGTFGAEEPMTRAMLVTVLARMDNATLASNSAFTDVAGNAWYAGGVGWAATNKIVTGDGEKFNPNSPVTREELCTILVRYMDYAGFALKEVTGTDGFTDMSKVSTWASDTLKQALKTGLITGKPDTLLDPKGSASRAEIATILERFIKGVLA